MDIGFVGFALASIYSVVISTIAFYHAHRWVKVSKGGRERGAMECGYCNRFVGKYFIDGAGKASCGKCHPEGYRDAVYKKSLIGDDIRKP